MSSAVSFCELVWITYMMVIGVGNYLVKCLVKKKKGGKVEGPVVCMCPPESQWSEGPSDERVSCGFHLHNAFWWGEFPCSWVKKQPHVVKTAYPFCSLQWLLGSQSQMKILENSHMRVYVLCFCVGVYESYLDNKCTAELLGCYSMLVSVYCKKYCSFCTDNMITTELKQQTLFEYINRI